MFPSIVRTCCPELLRSYGNGSVGVVRSGCLKLINPNFTGIRGDVHGVFGKGVKKRRLDVPSSSAGAVAQ